MYNASATNDVSIPQCEDVSLDANPNILLHIIYYSIWCVYGLCTVLCPALEEPIQYIESYLYHMFHLIPLYFRLAWSSKNAASQCSSHLTPLSVATKGTLFMQIANLSQTCKVFRQIANDPRLWRHKFDSTFACEPVATNAQVRTNSAQASVLSYVLKQCMQHISPCNTATKHSIQRGDAQASLHGAEAFRGF